MKVDQAGRYLRKPDKFHIFTLMKVADNFFELKNDTAQIILALQDEDLLAKVREVLEDATMTDGGWYDALDDEDRNSVDQAEADVNAGRILSHEQVQENLKQWLKA